MFARGPLPSGLFVLDPGSCLPSRPVRLGKNNIRNTRSPNSDLGYDEHTHGRNMGLVVLDRSHYLALIRTERNLVVIHWDERRTKDLATE